MMTFNAFWKNLAAIAIPAALAFGTAWSQGLSTKQGIGFAIGAAATAFGALHTTAPRDSAAVQAAK